MLLVLYLIWLSKINNLKVARWIVNAKLLGTSKSDVVDKVLDMWFFFDDNVAIIDSIIIPLSLWIQDVVLLGTFDTDVGMSVKT